MNNIFFRWLRYLEWAARSGYEPIGYAEYVSARTASRTLPRYGSAA